VSVATGVYEELLPCGGKLKVSTGSWEIFYYFPGPDLRHNGEILSIVDVEVKQYIAAFRENWQEYAALKQAIPSGGEFSKAGKMNMQIRVGGFREGVCLRSYHMPLANEGDVSRVISGYLYALERAPTIQRFLSTLPK
jgi:hypothetical protein